MIKKYHSKEGSSLLKYLSFSTNKTKNINGSFFTYSREAISQIMIHTNITETDKILMPSYQCNTVIDYILPFTKNIEFYEINEDLTLSSNEIINKINHHTKIIFFVHYFGIITNIKPSLIEILREKNIKIIHDLAHSFLSLYQRNFTLDTYSDYIISSIYKNIPLGVGAIGIGDFQQKNSIDVKEFFIINLKKILTNFRCLIGKRAFTYYHLHAKSSLQENTIIYKNSTLSYYAYQFLLAHINIKKLIEDKTTVTHQYFTLFENNKEFSNLIGKDILENNVLQAYPIKCVNIKSREKIFHYLKSHCIDIYSWPSYHPINSFDTLKDTILLLPLDFYSFQKSKEFLIKSNHE